MRRSFTTTGWPDQNRRSSVIYFRLAVRASPKSRPGLVLTHNNLEYYLFMKTFLTAIFILTTWMHQGNAGNISGYVKDAELKPIASVTVLLLNAKDSSVVKMNATDQKGAYSFDGIPSGNYLISTSSIGYSKSFSKTVKVESESIKIPDLLLEKAGTQLENVTVTTKKPLVEVRADKMIVNVEGTINATGNDALELLRRSPGVLVDKDDNISMSGKNGVEIYIDGKPSPLKGTDLANYLKSLSSTNVEAIELITNPSAKYEASGNAGIINIKLKKDKSIGTNGSVNAGYNIADFGRYNGGFSFNHRDKKVNVFGNYNYFNGLFHNRQTIFRDQADSLFYQSQQMKSLRSSHNYKAGMDYFINSKNTAGFMVNGNFNDGEMDINGPMTISPKSTGSVYRILKTNTDAHFNRKNLNANLNYRYADTSGRELNLDLDYGNFDNKSNQYVPNVYYGSDGTTELFSNNYRMISPSTINIYSIKVDYEQKLWKGKLGFGGKAGVVETNNDFKRYNVINQSDIYDRERSNHFDYSEKINALYVNYNRPFKSWVLQVGLRGENTHSDGRSTGEKYDAASGQYLQYDSSLKRSYTDLFPSASLSYNKNPANQFNISYSRRIDRPRYENLNPFEFKLNDYTYGKGNTALNPQYTNSFGISHTYKYKLTTRLNYSRVKGMFVQVMEPVENSKLYQTTRNLATQDVASLNVSYPFTYKSYTMFNNFTANYSYYKADFGNGNIIDRDAFNAQYYVQNSIKFGKKKDWTGELTGLYMSPFVWEGVFKGKSMGFVDVGLQKNILDGRGTIKATVSDIFRTMRFKGDGTYAGVYTRVQSNWESRQVRLNFSYRFGSAQIKSARQRKTGLEDESGRAGGGGGTPGQQQR